MPRTTSLWLRPRSSWNQTIVATLEPFRVKQIFGAFPDFTLVTCHLGQHLMKFLRVELQVSVLLFLVRLAVLQADLVDEHHLLEVVLVVEVGDVLLGQLLLDVLDLAPHDLVHVADGERGEGHLGDGDGVGVDGDHEGAGVPPLDSQADEGDPRDPGADDKNRPVALLALVGLLVPDQIENNLAEVLARKMP